MQNNDKEMFRPASCISLFREYWRETNNFGIKENATVCYDTVENRL